MTQPGARPFAVMEALLRRQRLLLALVLVLLISLSWLWIVGMARDMYGPMDGWSAWMMAPARDVSHLFLLWAMWAVMMAAMMLPSAAPTLLMYLRAARAQNDVSRAGLRAYSLVAGYLLVWALFSVGATALQGFLAARAILSPMMEPVYPAASAALLFVAGVYQLTPLKHACLRACRSPLSFLMRRWQPGWRGAFRLGIEHGAYCLGCCWALMLLLFAGGIMNIIVIAALTLWVLVEKLLPRGELGARISGVLLIATAGWMLFR